MPAGSATHVVRVVRIPWWNDLSFPVSKVLEVPLDGALKGSFQRTPNPMGKNTLVENRLPQAEFDFQTT